MAFNFQTSLAKYKRNYAASADARKTGAQAVRESPSVTAARNPQGYLDGVNNAVQSGKWQSRCNAVTTQEWITAYTEKGISNGNNGVNNLSAKAQKNMQDQQQYAQQVKEQVAAMPKGTEADSVARMMKNFELMRDYGQRA